VLPGYPAKQRRGDRPGETEDLVQIEEDFRPSDERPVLFHFMLPRRFVPRPNLKPLVAPSLPSIILRDDRLSVTFVASGAADDSFWINRLEPKETFADYEFHKLFAKPTEQSAKATLEIDLGNVKVAFGNK
jgi:hypothetical protein